jgi:phenylalanyl-tRNA synthetase alpha chain
MDVLERIDSTRKDARASLGRVEDERALEDWRIEFLGRKSETVSVLRSLAVLDSQRRREAGQAANALKTELEEAYRAKQEELAEAKIRKAQPLGRIHVAHCDLSGLALFEEALDQGVRAGEEVLAALGVPYQSLL